MKKWQSLFLCMFFALGAYEHVHAIDFKMLNQTIMLFEYGEGALGHSATRGNGNVYGYNGVEDNFSARQRVRAQLDAIASESLSGTVYFELGTQMWGATATGASLGADGNIVKLRRAHIDWMVPETSFSVRMGIWGLYLPNFVSSGSNVFADDVAGIVLSQRFTDNIGLTALWARPYNDNYLGGIEGYDSVHLFDNMDVFGLLLPIELEGVKMTPWFMYSSVGRNFLRTQGVVGNIFSYSDMVDGILPVNAHTHMTQRTHPLINNDMRPYADMWHVGFTGEIRVLEPWNFAWDVNYGSIDYGDAALRRQGYIATVLAEYKSDWGTPGLYAWYSSGDDGSTNNGSERMPTMTTADSTSNLSFFANVAPTLARKGVISSNYVGTWGIGARIAQVSLVEDLNQTLRVNYIAGTNHTDMGRFLAQPDGAGFSLDSIGYSMYMTTQDSAVEVALASRYKIYENLSMHVEASYLHLNFDHAVWGDGYTATDAWNIVTGFIYAF